MNYGSPLFLAGLAGAAIPILIHLLTRDRVRRVTFSTLRFFAKTSRNVLRRKRLQEAILVAMRCIACALLAVAFARPFLGDDRAGEGIVEADTACAIVVDLSGSMARAGLTDALRKEAESALGDLSSGRDAAALVTFTSAPLVRMPLTKQLGEIRSRIGLIEPGHGGTDIAEAVREGAAALKNAHARTKRVVLVSDLQRTGWHGAPADWKLPASVELDVRQVTPTEDGGNLAIVEADVPRSTVAGPAPQPVAARVTNFGQTERKGVTVTLRMHDKDVAAQQINLPPGASVPVRFRYAFDRAGDSSGTISIAGDDAVPDDDVHYLNVRVIPRIKVLILSGHAETSPAGRLAFFLKTALAPGELSPFQAQVVPAAKATAADVNRARVVVLANVGTVPAAIHDALQRLLQRGGGVLLLPGDAVKAEIFNATLADLSPCKLLNVHAPKARGDQAGAVLARVDYEHAIFAVFHRPHHGDLSRPKFSRFWEVTDSQLSRVLARFDDGRPAVLERQIDAGISMMLVSAPDMRWNDLPLRAIFLPYLHQTVRYLAVRTEGRTQFLVGGRLPVPEGGQLRGPDGKLHEGDVAAKPGFYAVLDEAGEQTFLYAVNRPGGEADPATVAADEIVAALVRAEGEMLPAEAEGGVDDAERPEEESRIWWYLVLAVCALSVGELWLGNRTFRH